MAKFIGADLAFNRTCGFVTTINPENDRSTKGRKNETWYFVCQLCTRVKKFPVRRWGPNANLAAENALEHHRCIPRNKEAVLNNASSH